jgi:hypothetical protein
MTEVQPYSQQAAPPTAGPLESPAPTIPASSQPDSPQGIDLEAKPAVSPSPVNHPPIKKQPDTGQCPFSIPNALHYAGKYRDQHRYDEAEQEYKRVLDCDHNNPEARDGLQRTKIEKSGN